MISHRFILSGPRWARLDLAFVDLCFQAKLVYTVERRVSWLRETVRCSVTCTDPEWEDLCQSINDGIEKFNEEKL